MKTIINFLIPVFFLLSTALIYPQTKGQVHLGLGSSLINVSTASGNTGVTGNLYNNFDDGSESDNNSGSSSFSFLVGYFPINKLRLDGGFSINAFERTEPAIYFNFGGRYFYYSNKKVMLNSGLFANFGLGTGTERIASSGESGYSVGQETTTELKKPINLSIVPIEFQYWPFEGGGLTTDFTYTWVFINGGDNNKEKSYGFNVGLLIRLN
jgi:hypothetical protein